MEALSGNRPVNFSCPEDASTKEDSKEGSVVEVARSALRKQEGAVSKKVTFAEMKTVVLVPERLEYREAGLLPALWYCTGDYNRFSREEVASRNSQNQSNLPVETLVGEGDEGVDSWMSARGI